MAASRKGTKRGGKPPGTGAQKRTEPKVKSAAAKKANAELEKVPSGPRLPAAAAQLRDTRMAVRRAQGWSWEMIAQEAGISVRGAKYRVKKRQENAPVVLTTDPAKIIEDMAEQLTLSVGDFEAMAAAYVEVNPNAAIGAKRSANDAREQLLRLLQATGRLPQELGALRHLIDLRAIGVRMLDAMDSFERKASELELDAATRKAITDATLDVRSTFNELIGLEDEPPVLESPAAA